MGTLQAPELKHIENLKTEEKKLFWAFS